MGPPVRLVLQSLLRALPACALCAAGCSKSPAERAEAALAEANLMLTDGRCDDAQAALDGVGDQALNVDYVLARASVHACRGGYSTTALFARDLPNMDTSEGALVGSLAAFSSSDMEDADDPSAGHLWSALDVLLRPGGLARSSHAGRLGLPGWGAADVERVEVLALYLILVQMGKFAAFYGNADADGAKGLGDGPSNCYLDYTDPAAMAAVDAGGTSCTSAANTGHAALDDGAGEDARRGRCLGVVLFNNLLDIAGNLAFVGENADGLVSLPGALSDACSVLDETQELGLACSTRTLERCVDDAANHGDVHLQRYYSVVYESMHQ